MAVLGTKVNSSFLWYAIAENEHSTVKIRNLHSEFRIAFPKMKSAMHEKAAWLFEEVKRILEANPDIKSVAIKENEFLLPRKEDTTKRFSSNLDGVIMAAAALRGLVVVKKLNKSMNVNSAKLLNAAETISGKTKVNWGKEIAEAILAASSELIE